MRCEAFIIHLARAERRRQVVEMAQAAVGMPCSIVDAVDGQRLSEAELAETYVSQGLFEPRYPFSLGRGEIACFLSHRRVWAEIVARGLDYAVVLEDDVLVEPAALARAVSFVQQIETTGDYISLQTRPLPKGKVVAASDASRIIKVAPPPFRTSGQIVTRGAAERLLKVTSRFDRPVDVLLQMTWLTGVEVLCVDPSGISDWPEDTGGSLAQTKGKRGIVASFRREVERTLYRQKIAALARSLPGN